MGVIPCPAYVFVSSNNFEKCGQRLPHSGRERYLAGGRQERVDLSRGWRRIGAAPGRFDGCRCVCPVNRRLYT